MKLSPKVAEILKNEFPIVAKAIMEQAMFEQEEDEVDIDIDVQEPEEASGPEVEIEPEPEVEVEDSLDVPSDFPESGVHTVIEAMVTMGLTSAIRDMSDDLEASYPELEGLAMDIQLRLIQTLADKDAMRAAADEIAKLIKFGREQIPAEEE